MKEGKNGFKKEFFDIFELRLFSCQKCVFVDSTQVAEKREKKGVKGTVRKMSQKECAENPCHHFTVVPKNKGDTHPMIVIQSLTIPVLDSCSTSEQNSVKNLYTVQQT